MRLGVALPQFGASCEPARIGEFARAVEDMGYDSVWVGDRLLTPVKPSDPYPGEPQPYPPQFTVAADPLVLWSAAAATTERVTLGSSTFTATWYNGPQLARALTTIDALSRGRLLVGIGTGWLRDEYLSSAVDWDSRGRRLDELVEFLRRWWTDNPVEFHGEFVQVPESVVDLRPARPGGPPLYFGGSARPRCAASAASATAGSASKASHSDTSTPCGHRPAPPPSPPDATRRHCAASPAPTPTPTAPWTTSPGACANWRTPAGTRPSSTSPTPPTPQPPPSTGRRRCTPSGRAADPPPGRRVTDRAVNTGTTARSVAAQKSGCRPPQPRAGTRRRLPVAGERGRQSRTRARSVFVKSSPIQSNGSSAIRLTA